MRKSVLFVTVIVVLSLVLAACSQAPSTPGATLTPIVREVVVTQQITATTNTIVDTGSATETPAATEPPAATPTPRLPTNMLEGQAQASNLIGQPVTTSDNQEAGTVEDLAVNLANTQVAYVIVSVPGEDNATSYYPVPWRAFMFSADEGLFLTVDKGTLEGAQSLDLKAIPLMQPDDWAGEFDAYWDEIVPAEAAAEPTAEPTAAPTAAVTGTPAATEAAVTPTAAAAEPAATEEPATGEIETGMEGIVLAKDIIGKDIQTSGGQAIGQVNDLVIDVATGQVTYVVLAAGEALGLGEKLVPIPLQIFTRDAATGILQAPVTAQSLGSAPNFDLNALPDPTSLDWQDAINSFWQSFQNP